MIFSGKKLRDALFSKGKLQGPAIRFHFDTEKELFHRKDDTKPLLSYRLKGDFRLSILNFAACMIGIMAGICLLKKKLKKKK